MKIGVWIDGEINKNAGGSYTYTNTLINGIDNFVFKPEVEVVFISESDPSNFSKACINIKKYQHGIPYLVKVARRILKLISKSFFKELIDNIDQNEKRKKDASATTYLTQQGVQLIFYPVPASHVINGIPYIVNNWDLAHHSTHAFPEIAANGGFHKRNEWHTKVMSYALLIFAETETGKKELSRYLNINPDKIKVLPIFSSNHLTDLNISTEEQAAILTKLNLEKQQFFFYPAQFWAHKNHYTLIKAFQKFNSQYPDFKLVLCGSDKGNVLYIKEYVKQLGLENSVIFSGFIDDDALYTLYKNSTALIMPTLLGPSNIPPIEGIHLGCPVLCSALEGHQEMLQNAALYFNPLDDLSMFESMLVVMDVSIRSTLLKNQQELSKTTPHTIERALQKLEENFLIAINIRNCWE